ncbi:MAG TPA: MFS transporter [Mycobacteriales bacterium]|jgi:MFS family permease|nr:MFS transporter [Mycobacteriales bacterium]
MTGAPARTHHRATFVVLAAASVAYALLQSLVVPVLPTLQHGLHTSQSNVTWVLTAYLLSASIFTPIVGRFGDMWGKERWLVVALIALFLGCVLSAVATSLPVMLGGRVVQGMGGGVLPLAFGILRDEYPKEKVAGAVGIIAAIIAAGAGFGLVLAGPIVSALDYHWLFWFPAIMIAIATVAAKVVVPPSPVRVPGRVNFLAAALLSAWLVAALVAVSEAPLWGWVSVKVLGLLALGIVLAVVWMMVELRSSAPLIDMRMMRLPVVWTLNLVAFMFGFGMYAVMGFLPEFLQTHPSAGYGFGLSVTGSGLLMLPLSAVMFVVGLWTGRLTIRYSGKAVMIAGSMISVVPFIMLVFAHAHEWEIVLITGLMGGGFGLAFSAMSALIVAGVPAEQTGVASGMNANIRTIGGSIGAAVMSSIVTATSHRGSLPTSSGYDHGFALLAVGAVAAAGAGLLVPSAKRVLSRTELDEAMPHAELAMVAAGTLVGDESE